ncbi:transposase [Streptomyces sp. NPDC051315]|uniref:transposase n=1 Tax=Streptomyces sp. NPDC051315 TaxID=3365650 RepID=UPI00378DECC5
MTTELNDDWIEAPTTWDSTLLTKARLQLVLHLGWTDQPDRCRRAGVPGGIGHQQEWRLALGLLDTLADWRLEKRGCPTSWR